MSAEGKLGEGQSPKCSAILYTIVARARRWGLDPEASLSGIIRRLPTTPAMALRTPAPAKPTPVRSAA